MKKLIVLSMYLLMALTVRSQSWRADADSLVVNHLFADKIGQVDIYSFPEMLTSADSIVLSDGRVLRIPYSNCCGYFVDLQPYANWSHSCSYCFVDASSRYKLISRDMPPATDSLTILSSHDQPLINPSEITFDSVFRRVYETDPEHLWAVLIDGEAKDNKIDDIYPQHWFDLSCVYTVLANVYGYKQKVRYADTVQYGHIIVSAPIGIRTQFNNPDLNGDDITFYSMYTDGDFFNEDDDDGYTKHTKTNLENIFKCFAGNEQMVERYTDFGLRELTEEDQLFIFVTGHGQYDNLNNLASFIVKEGVGYPNERVTDEEFVRWLRDIKCSQMTLFMENCHSGAFIEKFLDDIAEETCLCKNRIGQSASSASGVSHAEKYNVYKKANTTSDWKCVSEFVYYWASAALGYYPFFSYEQTMEGKYVVDGPWSYSGRDIGNGSMIWSDYFGNYETTHPHTQYDVNPDLDGDGILSLKELFEFANNLDTWSYQGYYHPNADTLDPDYQPEFPQQLYESSFTEEAATLAGYEGQIDSIADSGTATQPYRLWRDIWVAPNATLTMRDEVQSPEGVGISIRPSGQLIVDGGILTNLPETGSPMWNGVQVWGDATKHQYQENDRYWQGVLDLRNGAEIRNALTGVDVWKEGDFTTTGGIVRANHSRFVNNRIAVNFPSYENFYQRPGQDKIIKDNESYFHDCSFLTDFNYIGMEDFKSHVILDRVRGIKFKGCDFRLHPEAYSLWPNAVGLAAHDAGFKTDRECASIYAPCTEYNNTTFDGFHTAVQSTKSGSVGLRPITIQNTDFMNNDYGFYSINSGFTTILNSSFWIGRDSITCAAGVYAEATPDFIIEQNNFFAAKLHPTNTYGIIVKDSRSQNQIYGNTFAGLLCGNLSIGKNNTFVQPRQSATLNTLGLEYRCNSNTNNTYDFYVMGETANDYEGIQNHQGTDRVAANNTFSTNGLGHFINKGDNYDVYYYYDSTLLHSIPAYTFAVNLIPTSDTVGCPSHYGNGNDNPSDTITPVLPEPKLLQREMDYQEAYEAFENIKSLYDRMIDGGDTEGEIADIQTALPSDMWSLRSQLLGHSPYLSEEVLKQTADRDDVFPNSVLFEILSSNPDELSKKSLMNYLQDKEHPLPDYMLALLRQIGGGQTGRTAMESQMAKYSHDYRLAAGDIVRSIVNDTVVDQQALIGWLGNMNELEADREIVGIYLNEGDSIRAFALANMLPELYGLEEKALDEHHDYLALLSLYQGLRHSGRDIFQLTEGERTLVESLAENSTGSPQAMARSIMASVYGYRYDDCPENLGLYYLDRGWNGADASLSDEDYHKALGFSVELSPNPASTWVTVNYTLPAGATKAQMRISNLLGVTVATYNLSGNETQKVLDLRDLTPGVYTYTVMCGKYAQTGKLVIVK